MKMIKYVFSILSFIICIILLTSCFPNLKNTNQTITSSINQLRNNNTSSIDKKVISSEQTSHIQDKDSLFGYSEYNEKKEWKQYINDKYVYYFSVKYPTSFKVIEDKYFEGTNKQEGSPDYGIKILVDGNENEKISISAQESTATFIDDCLKREKFITLSGATGDLQYSYYDNNKRIQVELILYYSIDYENDVLNKSHHCVVIDMSKNCFDKNKDEILAILKSIEISIDINKMKE